MRRALAVALLVFASGARGDEFAIATTAGVRCFDVRISGSCLTTQSVALVGRYGEVHGSLVANWFRDTGVVVGATWGGEVGTRLYRLARDRVRLAGRLTLDAGVFAHGSFDFDFDFATFTAGPQLWVRLTKVAFFVARVAAGGSFVLFSVEPFGFRSRSVSPTLDAALGFAFDLP